MEAIYFDDEASVFMILNHNKFLLQATPSASSTTTTTAQKALDSDDVAAAESGGDDDSNSSSVFDIDATGYRGLTALQFAIWHKKLKYCKILLQHGADPNKDGTDLETSPLHNMMRHRIMRPDKSSPLHKGHSCDDLHTRLDLCQLLVQHGANINAKDCQRFTPLHYACAIMSDYFPHNGIEATADIVLSSVDFLLNNGANVNAISASMCPMESAPRYGFQYSMDRTPLLTAIRCAALCGAYNNKHVSSRVSYLVTKLTAAGADLHELNNERVPAISAIAGSNLVDSMNYIFEFRNVNIHARDCWRGTPLYYAVSYGSCKMVEILLHHYAATTATTSNGSANNNTADPIYGCVIKGGHMDMSGLAERMNTTDPYYFPLKKAITQDSLQKTKLLLKHCGAHARFTCTDVFTQEVVHVEYFAKSKAMLKLLVKYGANRIRAKEQQQWILEDERSQRRSRRQT